jgi:protein dithiol oxidoreductase (disulfide-forming)
MNRGWAIAGVIVVAAAAAAISMRACAGSNLSGQWLEGRNYQRLENPQPTKVARDKVEVIEVFWYGCGHCFALDPTLESWKVGKAAYIEFERVPVMWGPTHRQHARLFYTLQALGRTDLHTAVFDTIHRFGNMLAAGTDEEARALQLAFLRDHGVTEKAFNAAYDSKEVAANLERAEQLMRAYAVGSVPLMIVNGKYSTSVSEAGDAPKLVTLVDELAASERR